MKRAIALFLSTALVLAGCGLASAATDLSFEEGNFVWAPTNTRNVVVNEATASGGKAFKLVRNATGTLTGATGQITNIKVRARGEMCVDEWPNMMVTLNGNVVANQSVNTDGWVDYDFPVNVPAGANSVQISLTNERLSIFFGALVCSRNLIVDKVTLTTETATPTTTTTTTTTTAPPTTTTGIPTTTTTSTPLPPSGKYVAMGDSYSSGWGANRNPGVPGNNALYSNMNCGRSSKAAQVLLAAERNLQLFNVACGGANTEHILTKAYQGEPPQIEAVTSDTSLVTFTIGGNDAGLMYILSQCVKASSNCVPENTSGLWFSPASLISQMNTKINALQPKIEAVLRAIVQRAPTAKIRPAGYPNIIAPPGNPVGTCTWLNAGEQAFFQDATIRTNNKIRDAVNVVKAESGADIVFVDPYAVTSPFLVLGADGKSRDSCSSASNRYMNNVTEVSLSYGGWHPNIIGQDEYKQLYAGTI